MTIYALHGVGAILFWLMIFCVISCINEKFRNFCELNEEICDIGVVLIFICWMVLWIPSTVTYSSCMSSKNGYGGFISQGTFTDTIEKYNNKYDISISTEEEFKVFVREQWKLGNKIRNIGIFVLFIIFLLLHIYDYNINKIDRELDKINNSISILQRKNKRTEEEERLLFILKYSKEKIIKQMELAEVKNGIKALKKIEKECNGVDIQNEIDELEALYEFNDIDFLKEKYK